MVLLIQGGLVRTHKLLVVVLLLAGACKAQDDFTPHPPDGHPIVPDTSCPAPQACITSAVVTGTLLVVELDASVGACTLMVLDPATPGVIATRKVTTMQAGIDLGTASTVGLVAIVATTDGARTCQAPIQVN